MKGVVKLPELFLIYTFAKLVSAISYQISNFQQLIPFKYCEKGFLIDQKSPFSSRDIQIFLFSSSPLSLTVSQ